MNTTNQFIFTKILSTVCSVAETNRFSRLFWQWKQRLYGRCLVKERQKQCDRSNHMPDVQSKQLSKIKLSGDPNLETLVTLSRLYPINTDRGETSMNFKITTFYVGQ